jgi:hypothetical protein
VVATLVPGRGFVVASRATSLCSPEEVAPIFKQRLEHSEAGGYNLKRRFYEGPIDDRGEEIWKRAIRVRNMEQMMREKKTKLESYRIYRPAFAILVQ